LNRGFNIVLPYLNVNKIQGAKPKVKKSFNPVVDLMMETIKKKNGESWDKSYETYKLYNLYFKVEQREGNCIILRANRAIDHPAVGVYASDYDEGEPDGITIWKNLRALRHVKLIEGEWKIDPDFPLTWCYDFEDGNPVFKKIIRLPLDKLKKTIQEK